VTFVVLWYDVLRVCYLCCHLAVSMFSLLAWPSTHPVLDCSGHIPRL